ncbi:MAG TPA: hypothetical protein VF796_14000 [Humisphaera sp.]
MATFNIDVSDEAIRDLHRAARAAGFLDVLHYLQGVMSEKALAAQIDALSAAEHRELYARVYGPPAEPRDGPRRKPPAVVRLQPLRVTDGWRVVWNQFLDTDPPQPADDPDGIWSRYGDVLYMTNEGLGVLIDLAWHCEEGSVGYFRLVMVETGVGDDGWTRPLREFRSRARREVAEMIDRWLADGRTSLP